eukprot:TRINITY_DN15385_c0_g2_i1.p1 TRINITY_DN15385_c0_g2~~TRINITY_DN15385_c0_g2_i1.p1  ORF type:complete len:279 (+),score=71.77 TRINITY_DN15385_c0_g2_i1:71-907(+)
MAAASCCDELLSSIERYRARPRAGSAQGGKKQGGAYAKQDYWDQRFTKDDTGAFDWYVSYDELQAALEEHVPLRGDGMPHVLVVGCGNSSLSGSMYKAGYQRITNIDISEAVVRKMEQECSRPGMEWRAMDATAMEFEDARFDLAVEKGTVDALMSDGGVSADKATKLVAEVWRTLKPGGLLMLVSHSRWRGGLLDDALAAHCGADAAWEQVEARWNRLSDQATLINLIRAKLAPGQSFHEGFRDPVLLKAAGEETRKLELMKTEVDAATKRSSSSCC